MAISRAKNNIIDRHDYRRGTRYTTSYWSCEVRGGGSPVNSASASDSCGEGLAMVTSVADGGVGGKRSSMAIVFAWLARLPASSSPTRPARGIPPSSGTGCDGGVPASGEVVASIRQRDSRKDNKW